MTDGQTSDSRTLFQKIADGEIDDQLDQLALAVRLRQKIRDGAPVCPVCGELMEAPTTRYKVVSHSHNGFTVSHRVKR